MWSTSNPSDGSVVMSVRRADWRFLLPLPFDGTFEHLVILGGPPGLATRLQQVGIAAKVSDQLPSSGSADAVALLADASADLASAASILSARGALYYEDPHRVMGALRGTAARLPSILRSHGLTSTALYVAAPNYAECKRWIPVDVPYAVRWYLSTYYVPGTRAKQAVQHATQVTSRWLRWFAPNVTSVATRGLATNRPALFVRALSAVGHSVTAAHPFLLTSGFDDASRLIMLPFVNDSESPSFVVKAARLPSFNTVIEFEQRSLTSLHARIPPELRSTIPRPLGMFSHGPLRAGIESVATGRSLLAASWDRRSTPASRRCDLWRAAQWLGTFHRSLYRAEMTWSGDQVARHIEQQITDYRQTYGTTDAEARLFAKLRQYCGSLGAVEVPLVRQHNDFGPWNVISDRGKLTVIDWEPGRTTADHDNGPALCNLLYFVTYWYFAERRFRTVDEERSGIIELFLVPTSQCCSIAAIRQEVADYMCRLHLDRRVLPILLVYMWIEHALARDARKRQLGFAPEQIRRTSRFVMYLGVLADHVDELLSSQTWQAWSATSHA